MLICILMKTFSSLLSVQRSRASGNAERDKFIASPFPFPDLAPGTFSGTVHLLGRKTFNFYLLN